MHALFGTFLIPFTTLCLIALSFAARYSWHTTLLTILLFLLLLLQFALALVGFLHSELAPLAGLHGLNALFVLALALYLTYRRWAFQSLLFRS